MDRLTKVCVIKTNVYLTKTKHFEVLGVVCSHFYKCMCRMIMLKESDMSKLGR